MKNQTNQSTLSIEQIESIIIPLVNKAQSIIDDDGVVIFKVFSDFITLESEACTSIECDCGEINVRFETETSLVIPNLDYINGEDLDSLNPVLHFKNITIELDMCDEV